MDLKKDDDDNTLDMTHFYRKRILINEDSIKLKNEFGEIPYPMVNKAINIYARDFLRKTKKKPREQRPNLQSGFDFKRMQKEIISTMFDGIYDVIGVLPHGGGKTLPIVVNAVCKHYFKQDGLLRCKRDMKPFSLILVASPEKQNQLFKKLKLYVKYQGKCLKLEKCQYFQVKKIQPIIIIGTIEMILTNTEIREKLVNLSLMGFISSISFYKCCNEIVDSGKSIGTILRPSKCQCGEDNSKNNMFRRSFCEFCFSLSKIPLSLMTAKCNLNMQKRCIEKMHLKTVVVFETKAKKDLAIKTSDLNYLKKADKFNNVNKTNPIISTIDLKHPPQEFFHLPYVQHLLSSQGYYYTNSSKWLQKLLDMDHNKVLYSGTLELLANDQLNIVLNEPIQVSSRMTREWGSWRIFKLKIPDTSDKIISKSRLKEYLSMKRLNRCLPFLNSKFVLELSHFKNDDEGIAGVFIVQLASEVQRNIAIVNAKRIQEWHINTKENKNMRLGKYIKRFKLAHSATIDTLVLKSEEILETEGADVYAGHNLMNDGCGVIEKDTFAAVYQKFKNEKKLSNIGDEVDPVAIQVRIGPCKGVLLKVEYKLDNYKVILPKSMVKFNMAIQGRTKTQKTIEVNHTNVESCRLPARLNRENIFLLEARGIKFEIFEKLLKQWMDKLKNKFYADVKQLGNNMKKMKKQEENRFFAKLKKLNKNDKPATESNTKHHEMFGVNKVLHGFNNCLIKQLLSRTSALRLAKLRCRKDMEKFQIEVAHSRRLMLIPDPTGVLKPGECFVKLTFEEEESKLPIGILKGEIVAIREPSYFQGDILVLKCKNIPELQLYTNVLILSIQRNEEYPYSAAELMSGGDFDGDTAFISWNKLLIPKRMAWEDRRQKSSILCREDRKSINTCDNNGTEETVGNFNFEQRREKMIDFTLRYRETSAVWISKLGNIQRRYWDHYTVNDEISLEIGKFCFQAVDRPEYLKINGKNVDAFINELDQLFVQNDLAKKIKTSEGFFTMHRLANYDFRVAYKTKGYYSYKSSSILGKLYEIYKSYIRTWKSEQNENILVGKKQFLSQDAILRYKLNYFDHYCQGKKLMGKLNLELKVKSMYEKYIFEVHEFARMKSNIKDIFTDLIEKIRKEITEKVPNLEERRLVAVLFYEFIQGKTYLYRSKFISEHFTGDIHAEKILFLVCAEELIYIKNSMEHFEPISIHAEKPTFHSFAFIKNVFSELLVKEYGRGEEYNRAVLNARFLRKTKIGKKRSEIRQLVE